MALWTPAEITTALWLDASDSATITESGGAVSQWDDKSGNARHATQGTAGAKPTLTAAGLDGKNVISFDGGDHLRVDALAAVLEGNDTPFSVFVVGQTTNATVNDCFVSVGTSASGSGWIMLFTLASSSKLKITRTDPAGGTVTVDSTASIDTNPHIYEAVFAGTTASLYIDGDVGPSGAACDVATMGTALDRGAIGALVRNVIDSFLTGYIAEIAIVPSAVDQATRELIEGYLAHKWGIEGNLDAGHPYKSAAPTDETVGTGALVAQSATLEGEGQVSVSGAGSLEAQSASIEGAGSVGIEGTGALVAQSASIDGAGGVSISGSGDLTAQSATLDGAGNVSIGGTGEIVAQSAAVDGSGTVTVTIRARAALTLISNTRVIGALTSITPYMTRVAAALELISPVRSRVQSALELKHALLSIDRVQKALTLVYTMAQAATIQVTTQPSATIRGQVIPLETASVEMDEGDYAWRCRLSLANPLHYGLFHEDDAFTVALGAETYAFIVESVAFDRSGQVQLSATISGIGPAAIYASPRAQKISRTWDSATLATAVVTELFGVGVVEWGILNWTIPANALAVENQTPMDVLQRLAEAAGACVESNPDGTLYVRYLFPVSVPGYSGATADQEYNDTQHKFADSEQTVRAVLVNKLRILEAEQSSNRDAIEFEQDDEDPARGELKVFPSPWRSSVTLEHTGDAARVSATARGVETEELTETVEVIAGKGSVSKPIHTVESLTWLTVNLAGVTFEADSSEFTTTHATLKESLVEITYTTRYHAFDAAAYEDAEVQFLVREEA